MANLSFSSISTSFKSLSLSSSPFLSGSQKHVAPSSISLPSNSSRKLGSLTIRMAHKKGAGSSRNGRDSKPKMLGVKIYGDQLAKPGAIIIRQRGTKFYPGENVGMGKDHTIFSLIDGLVKFEKYGVDRKKISVYPHEIKPENPNSFRVKRREFFRKQRVRRAAKKGGFVKTKVVLPSNADVAEPVVVDS